MPTVAKVHHSTKTKVYVIVSTTEPVVGRSLADSEKNGDATLDYMVGMSGITLVSFEMPNKKEAVDAFLSRLRTVSDENKLAFSKHGFDDLDIYESDDENEDSAAGDEPESEGLSALQKVADSMKSERDSGGSDSDSSSSSSKRTRYSRKKSNDS